MDEQVIAQIYEVIKGRALLEDELWWMIESSAGGSHFLERKKVTAAIEQLILEKKIERKYGVESVRVESAKVESVEFGNIGHQEKKGRSFLSFFASLYHVWSAIRRGRAAQDLEKKTIKETQWYHCNRCNASGEDIHVVFCQRCNKLCAYCRRCLTMGRSTSCTPYYLIPGEQTDSCRWGSKNAPGKNHAGRNDPSKNEAGRNVVNDGEYQGEGRAENGNGKRNGKGNGMQTYRWQHVFDRFPTLTPAQQGGAKKLLEFLQKWKNGQRCAGDEFLIWAVCGAGKTEVMFPVLLYALGEGARILWATPRRDVVLELAPRLSQAFPFYEIGVLHGKSKEKWTRAPLVLSTTHQALRFYRHFDLVIVDEVDAYPYTNDDLLPFAVQRSRKIAGKTIYLTATPRREHQLRMKQQPRHPMYLPHEKIPLRYHGHPLPVPVIRTEAKLNNRLKSRSPISSFQRFLQYLAQNGAPGFIFVHAVYQLSVIKEYVLALDPRWSGLIETVHAADSEREEKVSAMRQGRIKLLVTTTIMERGVTIPGISVLVFQANAPIFDEATLVQIAGRVGRSAASPNGLIIFLAGEPTGAMKAAVKQIKAMNRIAKKAGYLTNASGRGAT
ncbi:DEAD/DEAH box helicase [Aneurinibacillus terranovensis]|uniref:DEAD/DEAH box helicase n=1 Tax=Aneurinibacillus terranovensis TaxID=278991 RepID=UPI0004120429|nr:helicase-related protein [Aneurinibacillus terranovensis]